MLIETHGMMAIAPLVGAALIGGGLSLAGSLTSTFAGGSGGIKGKSFTERMARNRYTYQVEDLERAGLNPALAYGQSPGTSASGIALQQRQDFGGVGQAAGQAAKDYIKARETSKQIKLIEAQTKAVKQGERKTGAEANIIEQGLPKAQAEAALWGEAAGAANRIQGAGLNPLSVWDRLNRWWTGEKTHAADDEPIVVKRTNEAQRRAIGRRPRKGGQP